ncbi:hypothetical protein EPR50_G00092870 [Xyrichtys novacula]|uniref:Uncharacterized protein n=1 Tax=Xyrichtys novacula TaxID=13765 RepID=A0AAV1HD59_XYRNO|nr:hypothetical protein EPR50_G00092870 [Xyrichtys novacula]
MNQCGDREEGAASSKTSLWGEHEGQTTAQRQRQQYPPDFAGPETRPEPGSQAGPGRRLSVKTLQLMFDSFQFKHEQQSTADIGKHQIKESARPGPGPGSIYVPPKSDQSVTQSLKSGLVLDYDDVQSKRSYSPESVPSFVSLKSDWSMRRPLAFKSGHQIDLDKAKSKRSYSTESLHSRLSLNSDWSMRRPLAFTDERISHHLRVQQKRSEALKGQPAQHHQTQLDSIFILLQENIFSFVKDELKRIQRFLGQDFPECLESQYKDEDQEQRRSRDAFLKITLHFLRKMKQEELADSLQSSKMI